MPQPLWTPSPDRAMQRSVDAIRRAREVFAEPKVEDTAEDGDELGEQEPEEAPEPPPVLDPMPPEMLDAAVDAEIAIWQPLPSDWIATAAEASQRDLVLRLQEEVADLQRQLEEQRRDAARELLIVEDRHQAEMAEMQRRMEQAVLAESRRHVAGRRLLSILDVGKQS